MRSYAADADGWLARNAAQMAELKRSAETARTAIENVRGHARSDDGSVEVVVDVNGEIEALEFSESALRKDRRVLSNVVLSTIQAAKVAAAVNLRQQVDKAGQNPAADAVLKVLGFDAAELPRHSRPMMDDESDEEPWGWKGILQRP